MVKIALNQQGNQDAQTQQFIDAFGFENVVDDASRTFHGRFFPSFATTTFAIINGIENSPSHQLWEIVSLRDDLGRSEQAVTDLQQAIHSIVRPPQSYAEWTRQHGLAGASSEFDADPDKDLSPNFLEFAFGTNPTQSRFHHRPTLTHTQDHVILAYRQAINVTGIRIQVSQSYDLRAWKEFTAPVKAHRIATFPTFEFHEITIPIALSQQVFFRIRVAVDNLSP